MCINSVAFFYEFMICNWYVPKLHCRNFSSQVRSMKKFDLFDLPGRHTFFIPVDSAFMVRNLLIKFTFSEKKFKMNLNTYTLHYCLPGELKINPEFQIFWHFLNILNLLRCINDRFKKFEAFKPQILNFKVPW